MVSRLPPTTNCRPIKTRFPYGSGPEDLNQAADGNSPDHYAKGTPSHVAPKSHSAPTACKRMVSGSHSSPNRGSSHLSIAILSSLSVIREYLALRDGPRRFNRDSTWPDYSGTPREIAGCHIRDCHPLWFNFPKDSVNQQFCNSHVRGPTTPQRKPPRFGLLRFRSPLLTQSIFLSFPVGT